MSLKFSFLNIITKIYMLSILAGIFLTITTTEAKSSELIKKTKNQGTESYKQNGVRSLNLYGLPCSLYESAYHQGIFYPKITATPWVLISKTETVDDLKRKLLNELKEQIPEAKISGYRTENITVSEYIQDMHLKGDSVSKNITNNSTSGITFLKYENKELTKEMQSNEKQVVNNYSQNYVMTRFVVEFIHISEEDILRVKASHITKFNDSSKQIRTKIDKMIAENSGKRRNYSRFNEDFASELYQLLMQFKDLSSQAYYSAKQDGLTELQVSELYDSYLGRVKAVEKFITLLKSYDKSILENGDFTTIDMFDDEQFKLLYNIPKLN